MVLRQPHQFSAGVGRLINRHLFILHRVRDMLRLPTLTLRLLMVVTGPTTHLLRPRPLPKDLRAIIATALYMGLHLPPLAKVLLYHPLPLPVPGTVNGLSGREVNVNVR